MKMFIITAIALTTITSLSFAKSSAVIENYVSTCSNKTVVIDTETGNPKSKTTSYTISSQLFISEDQLEETEIYNYVAASDENGDLGVSKDSVVNNVKHSKISETEIQTNITAQDSSRSESIWMMVEKTEVKEVALRTSHAVDEKEVKEKILRTKTTLSPTEYTIDLMTLNPQDVLMGEEQLLFSFKTCHFKK